MMPMHSPQLHTKIKKCLNKIKNSVSEFNSIQILTRMKFRLNKIKPPNPIKKIPFVNHHYVSKATIPILMALFVCMVLVLSISKTKTAIYINGEKAGYAENTKDAIILADRYSDFFATNHGKLDIVLQDEISLSPNLLSGSDIENIMNNKKDEEFTDAYLLYIDDALVAATEDANILKNTIAQIEQDVGNLLGYNASICNNIEIKNSFFPVERLTDTEQLYQTITSYDVLTKDDITSAVIPSDTSANPIKLYSVNGILFEAYRYVREEQVVKSTTIYKEDASMYIGSEKCESKGKDGFVINVYKETIFNDEPQQTELLDSTVVKTKTDTVIIKGTKEINWKEKPKVLLFPLKTDSYSISSEFGMRLHPVYNERRLHNGIDLSCNSGTKVIAADSGTVIESTNNGGNAGIYIAIQHKNGLITKYLHLSKRLVKVGDYVYAGQEIALSGNTGISTGPHLHFTVIDINGNYVNPRRYTKNL